MLESSNTSRRNMLVGASAAIGSAMTANRARAANDEWMTEPKKILNTYIRVLGDLSGKVCPWRFDGTVLGVTPTEAPRVLFALEGAETKKVFLRENGFEIWSKVMTMFKNPVTGEVLNGKAWKNPYTGAINTVKPNIFGSKTLYQVSDSGLIRATRKLQEANMAPPGIYDLRIKFLVLGDKVQIDAERFGPDGRAISPTSFATNTAELADIRDVARPRVEATFSGTDVVPWHGFLEMPQHPGNAVWHSVGRKMEGFEGLTPEYLEQARILIPDVLDWAS